MRVAQWPPGQDRTGQARQRQLPPALLLPMQGKTGSGTRSSSMAGPGEREPEMQASPGSASLHRLLRCRGDGTRRPVLSHRVRWLHVGAPSPAGATPSLTRQSDGSWRGRAPGTPGLAPWSSGSPGAGPKGPLCVNPLLLRRGHLRSAAAFPLVPGPPAERLGTVDRHPISLPIKLQMTRLFHRPTALGLLFRKERCPPGTLSAPTNRPALSPQRLPGQGVGAPPAPREAATGPWREASRCLPLELTAR